MWRPSTAIRLADTDGNPATTADPAWTPLLVNPPYPDYVSGYNAFAASITRTLDDLFGSTAPRHNPDLDRRARSLLTTTLRRDCGSNGVSGLTRRAVCLAGKVP